MNSQIDQPQEDITVHTFRFKFSQEFTEQMANFAKIHQYDDRKAFKEAWQEWIKDDDINSLINDESKDLINRGYEGNILEKMFKSARYYYRTKSNNKEPPTVPRKEYIGFSSNMLEIMDNHIKAQFLENAKADKNNKMIAKISPANAYTEFCNTHHVEIDGESKNIFEQYENQYAGKDEIDVKFKKTYKNRYFLIGNPRFLKAHPTNTLS